MVRGFEVLSEEQGRDYLDGVTYLRDCNVSDDGVYWVIGAGVGVLDLLVIGKVSKDGLQDEDKFVIRRVLWQSGWVLLIVWIIKIVSIKLIVVWVLVFIELVLSFIIPKAFLIIQHFPFSFILISILSCNQVQFGVFN